MSKIKSRPSGKPVWLDESEWKTTWLIPAVKMYTPREPELVRVIKTKHGWTGVVVGTNSQRDWHSAVWREATAEECLKFNSTYGVEIPAANDGEKKTG